MFGAASFDPSERYRSGIKAGNVAFVGRHVLVKGCGGHFPRSESVGGMAHEVRTASAAVFSGGNKEAPRAEMFSVASRRTKPGPLSPLHGGVSLVACWGAVGGPLVPPAPPQENNR